MVPPSLLRITTPSFRARYARKSKSRFPVAARLPLRQAGDWLPPQNGARTVHCCHIVGRDDSARHSGPRPRRAKRCVHIP